MTKEQAVNKLLAWVSAQVGYREGANNYNKYAEDKRLVQLYGWYAQNQPWCDLFTDEAFIECFGLENAAAMTYQPIGGGSAACRTSAGFFKSNGAFTRSPEPGDIVFFYVNGDINHQGIVIRVYTGSIVTVEGNSSDQVSERVYQMGAANIAGYGRPKWSVVEDIEELPTEPVPEIESATIMVPLLRRGDIGAAVAAMQAALEYLGYGVGPDGADGDFGPNTERAARLFQEDNDLEPDGICGKATWEALMSM